MNIEIDYAQDVRTDNHCVVKEKSTGFQAMTLRPVKHWKIQKIHKRAI